MAVRVHLASGGVRAKHLPASPLRKNGVFIKVRFGGGCVGGDIFNETLL